MAAFFHHVAMMLAAAAANADPVGPNGPPTSVTPYESDTEKGWWDTTWVNGDSSAYTQISEDNKVSVSKTLSPGVTDSAVGGSMYWTSTEITSGDLWIRHSKNGIYSDWVAINIL